MINYCRSLLLWCNMLLVGESALFFQSGFFETYDVKSRENFQYHKYQYYQ